LKSRQAADVTAREEQEADSLVILQINTLKRVSVCSAMQTHTWSKQRGAEAELGQLLERVATELPLLVLVLVLRPLPAVELARLACVHKAYRLVLVHLRKEQPGRRYAKPTEAIARLQNFQRVCRAAAYGDVAVLGSMFEGGVSEYGVSYRRISRTSISNALDYAAEGGHLDAVELLVRAGADVHFGGGRALRSACRHGYCDVVAALIRNGAHVNLPSWMNSELTPLTLSSMGGHLDVVDLLLANNADVHAGSDIALWSASYYGHTAVVQLLLQWGADVNALDNYAFRSACRRGHLNVVELLLANNADVHAEHDNALRCASELGHTAVVRLLLRRGANVHAGDNYAIRKASENRHTGVVQVLLEHGAILPTPSPADRWYAEAPPQ
jgi:hypothetical protein